MGNEIDVETVTDLANRLIKKDEEIARLRGALKLICLLEEKKTPHLGRVRWSGIGHECIPCICELALSFGAYGEYAYAKDFEDAFKQKSVS